MRDRVPRRLVALVLVTALMTCAALALSCKRGGGQSAEDTKASQGYWKGGAGGKGGAPAPPPGMEPGMKKKAGQ